MLVLRKCGSDCKKLADGMEALFDVATTKLTLDGSIFEIGKKDKLLKRSINQALTQPT